MTNSEIDCIVSLIRKEVVPAIGCTEPIAVALCVAKAKEILGSEPSKVEVFLSANMLKNAMGVGIPGTTQIGLPIAVALGVIVGDSSLGLEVLKNSNSEAVKKANIYMERAKIHIQLKKECTNKLYIEVVASDDSNSSTAIIEENHTQFTYLSLNSKEILNNRNKIKEEAAEVETELTMRKIYDFTRSVDFKDIEFILESGRLNRAAAVSSLEQNYGHSLGRMLLSGNASQIMGEGLYSKALSYTSAACDARMAGAMIPVMSNSGSGNQGISATLPVVVYAEETNKSQEELARALAMSHLTAIYIKQSLGRLSALCGCVVAATGSSCGITLLMGGGYKEVSYAVQNMVANITGMICDGAKPSCSLKVATGVSTALLSAMMAIDGKTVTAVEGIIDKDVDQSIRNLTKIGSQGMNETDALVLDIMTNKC